MDTLVVSSALVAAALMEGLKWLVRLVMKQPEFDFPVKFYVFILPVLSFLAIPLLAFLGFVDFVMPLDWLMWGQELGRVVLTSLLAVASYELTFKPLKAYYQARKAKALKALKVK